MPPMYARFWTDALGDPKLQRAEDEGAKHLVLLPWLLLWAKRADANGRLETDGMPSTPREIARQIPSVNARSVAQCEEELFSIGVLTKDADSCYRFVSWDFRNSGKASDSKEAVAARVRAHRARKAEKRTGNEPQTGNAHGNASNALPKRDVTSKRLETREERRETREEREEKKTGSGSKGSLPAAAAEFGRHFYADAAPDRKRDVKRQLLATLNGGATLRRGHKVRAISVARLEAKCREVIAEGVDNPDRAIVVLLEKLNNTADVTEGAAAETARSVQVDAREGARRFAAANAWIGNHPDVAEEIDLEVNAQCGTAPPADAPANTAIRIAESARRLLRQSLVLQAWENAGQPAEVHA